MARYLKQGRDHVARPDPEVSRTVAAILEDIAARGEAAVRDWSVKLDGWDPPDFRVADAELERAGGTVPADLAGHIDTAAAQVRAFAEAQRATLLDLELEIGAGAVLGHRHVPVGRVGAYIPGGRYKLISSALMSVLVAKVAGVERVTAATPAGPDGVPDATLHALRVAGADAVYAIGGVPAMGALAHGALPGLEPIDLLVGAGNAYVAEAKRQLFGIVGIDLLAGPTEILVIADETADPFVVAVDLLSQAEHGPDSPAVLITPSEDVARAALAHLERLLPDMPTVDMAGPAWRDHGEVHVVPDLDAAYALADTFASEHVQILTAEPRRALEQMRHYGALFLGEGTCVSYGDKVIGTNHVLPTRGAARYTGGLWVGKYLRTVTYQEVNDPAASARLGELCGRAARVELFEGHARSGDVRAAKYAGAPLPWATSAPVAG